MILFEIHPYSLGLWTGASRGSLGVLFTLETFYTKQFSHKTFFTPENFTCLYTKNVYTDFFATNPLHQRANTPKKINTKSFIPKTVAPETFYVTDTFYSRVFTVNKFWEDKWNLVTVVLLPKTRFASSQSLVPTQVVLVTSNPRFATTKPSSATNLRVQEMLWSLLLLWPTLIFAAAAAPAAAFDTNEFQQKMHTSQNLTGGPVLVRWPYCLLILLETLLQDQYQNISKSNATPTNEIDS